MPYLISALVGAAIVVTVVCTGRVWELSSINSVMGMISDGFFVAGVVLAGIGLIVVFSHGGVFDMLGYAVLLLFSLFQRDVSKRKYRDYKEYREVKAAKEHRSVAFMLIVGIVYIAIAAVFLILYYQL